MPKLIPLNAWNNNNEPPSFYTYINNGLSCPACTQELLDTDGVVHHREETNRFWVRVACKNNSCGFASYRVIKVNIGD